MSMLIGVVLYGLLFDRKTGTGMGMAVKWEWDSDARGGCWSEVGSRKVMRRTVNVSFSCSEVKSCALNSARSPSQS